MSDYDQDQPLRLKLAAAIAFPDGSMTASGLRKERDKGRLVVEQIAGKDYTTLKAIEQMREKCRLQPKVRDCGSARHGETGKDGSPTQPSGSSATENIRRARSAAQMIVDQLKQSSRPISTASTSRRPKKAPVIPLKFPSPTS